VLHGLVIGFANFDDFVYNVFLSESWAGQKKHAGKQEKSEEFLHWLVPLKNLTAYRIVQMKRFFRLKTKRTTHLTKSVIEIFFYEKNFRNLPSQTG
jgi:hypothetical protein